MFPGHSLPNLHCILPTMFSISPFDFPHFSFKILFASAYLMFFFSFFCIFPSLFLSPSPALESTFTQFNSDTRTVSFMADHACVFSIKPGSCTLFIWETIILMAQQKLMESRLVFFPGEVSERPVPQKRVRLVGMESKTVGTV